MSSFVLRLGFLITVCLQGMALAEGTPSGLPPRKSGEAPPTVLPDFKSIPDFKFPPVPDVPLPSFGPHDTGKLPPFPPLTTPRARVAIPLTQATKPEMKFPCDLEKAKKDGKLPEIVFIGESHDTLAAELAQSKLRKQAKAGSCLVLQEGLYCLEDEHVTAPAMIDRMKKLKDEGVLGFDEPFTHALSLLVTRYDALLLTMNRRELAKAKVKAKIDLFLVLNEQPFLKESWKGVKRPFEEDGEEAIAKLFDVVAGAPNEREGDKRLEEALKKDGDHDVMQNDHAMLNVLQKWARSFSAMASTPGNQKKFHTPSNLKAILDDLFRARDPDGALDALAADYRNQFMAPNIARYVCRAIELGLPVVKISTGRKHPPGLKAMLEKASGGLLRIAVKHAEDFVAEPEEGVVQIHNDLFDGKPSTVSFTKNGVEYQIELRDVEGFAKKGRIRYFSKLGQMKEEPGRTKYFLGEIEKAMKTNAKLKAIIEPLKLPASSSIKDAEVSGPDAELDTPAGKAKLKELGSPLKKGDSGGFTFPIPKPPELPPPPPLISPFPPGFDQLN